MFRPTEVNKNLQECNTDADRLMAQLQEIEVRMRDLTEELEGKTRDYETLQYEQQGMFLAGKVPPHSPLWYATVSNFANAGKIQLMILSPRQGCKMRWTDLKTLFKVTSLLTLHCYCIRLRSAMSRFFFMLPELQKKVKVEDDVIQARELDKHFLLPLRRPFFFFNSFN